MLIPAGFISLTPRIVMYELDIRQFISWRQQGLLNVIVSMVIRIHQKV